MTLDTKWLGMTPEERSAYAAASWRRVHLLSRCVGGWRRAVADAHAEVKREVELTQLSRVFSKLRCYAKRQGMRDAFALQDLAKSHWRARRCSRFIAVLLAGSHRARALRTCAQLGEHGSMKRYIHALVQWYHLSKERNRISVSSSNRLGAVRAGLLQCVRRWRRRVIKARELRYQQHKSTVIWEKFKLQRGFWRWLATHRRSTMAGNALERHHFKLGNKICKGRSGNLLERSGFERFARNLVRCGIRRLTLVSCTKLLIPYEAIALLKHNIKRMLSQLRYMKDVAFDRLSRAQSAILMQRSRSAIRAALRTWMRYAANRQAHNKIFSSPVFAACVLGAMRTRRLRGLFAGFRALRRFAAWKQNLRGARLVASSRPGGHPQSAILPVCPLLRPRRLLRWGLLSLQVASESRIRQRGSELFSGSYQRHRSLKTYFFFRWLPGTRSLALSRDALLRGILFWKYFRLMKYLKYLKKHASLRVHMRNEIQTALLRHRKRCSRHVVTSFLKSSPSITGRLPPTAAASDSVPVSIVRMWETMVRDLLRPRVVSPPQRGLVVEGPPASPDSVSFSESHPGTRSTLPLHKMRPRTSLLDLDELPIKHFPYIASSSSAAPSGAVMLPTRTASFPTGLAHARPRNFSPHELPAMTDSVTINDIVPVLEMLGHKVDAVVALKESDAAAAASAAAALKSIICDMAATVSEICD